MAEHEPGRSGNEVSPASAVRSIEVFDPGSELFVSLTAGGGGTVILGSEVIAASPIPEDGLATFDPGTPLSLETERGELAVELEAEGEPIRLGGTLTGEWEIRRAVAHGLLSLEPSGSGPSDRERQVRIDGHGVIHSASRLPSPRSLRRDLTVMLDEGGLLSVAAAGPEGSWCHGEEEVVAAISHPGGALEFGRALISTESDPAGRQQRATLELWPASEDVAVLHGAGHSIAGCTARLADAEVKTALFRWSLDGHLGSGRYELIRPRRDKETAQ